jgi:hypothetical protein
MVIDIILCIFIVIITGNLIPQKSALVKMFLPVIVILMFLFWEELTLMTMVQVAHNNNAPVTEALIIWSLLLSGILPLRVLAFFTPPIGLLNLLTGAASIFFYFMSLSMQLPILAEMTLK